MLPGLIVGLPLGSESGAVLITNLVISTLGGRIRDTVFEAPPTIARPRSPIMLGGLAKGTLVLLDGAQAKLNDLFGSLARVEDLNSC